MVRPDPTSFLPLKTDVFYILLAMSDQPRHGYGIIGEAESRSDGVVRLQTGALYRALRRLLHDGLIEVAGQPAGETSTDERRRYYRLTAIGRDVLEADVARMTRAVRVARRAGAGRGAG
jgi:DNA-binding PadR family transcriptional regulator